MLACKSLSRARREHPEQVVGTWGSAEEQEKPRGLQVPNSRQAGEQLVLGLAFAVQLLLHEGFAPEWSAQHQ